MPTNKLIITCSNTIRSTPLSCRATRQTRRQYRIRRDDCEKTQDQGVLMSCNCSGTWRPFEAVPQPCHRPCDIGYDRACSDASAMLYARPHGKTMQAASRTKQCRPTVYTVAPEDSSSTRWCGSRLPPSYMSVYHHVLQFCLDLEIPCTFPSPSPLILRASIKRDES